MDYLEWRYKDVRGMKKFSIERLMADLKSRHEEPVITEDDDGNVVEEPYDPAKHGISSDDLLECFAKKHNISMYAMDERGKVFLNFTSSARNAPALCFKVFNEHMYPVTDKSKVIVIARTVSGFQSKEMERKDAVAAKKDADVEVVERPENNMTAFLDALCDAQSLPRQSHMGAGFGFDGQDILYYVLGGKRTVFADNVQVGKAMCDAMEINYEGQGPTALAVELLNSKYNVPKSHLNPVLRDIMLLPGNKRRAHHAVWQKKKGDLSCYDINKCYTACMYDPMMKWGVFDYADQAVPCDLTERYDGVIEDGYYGVQTKDTMLLTGNKVYSSPVLRKAVKEGIPFKAVWKAVPSTWLATDTLRTMIDDVCGWCEDVDAEPARSAEVAKTDFNRMPGLFGKTSQRWMKAWITQSMDDVLCAFAELRDNSVKPFVVRKEHRGKTFYIYGVEQKVAMSESNVPFYVQITDHANIMLYDLVKAAGGF